jgi:putative Mg2+ transporter-C (MgtC) family protein
MEWFHLDDIFRLTIAALLGAMFGLEREAHGQAAGLRTYVLVCTGACLMMLLSLHIEALFHSANRLNSAVNIDPGRIASYAIAGMGFLGAGAIIKGRGSVKGLTTAAGLWLVTGVGLCVGANLIAPALYTTLISIAFLVGFGRLKIRIPRTEFIIMTLKCRGTASPLDEVKKIISSYEHMSLHFINYAYDLKGDSSVFKIRFSHRKPVDFELVLEKLRAIESIEEVSWEESDIP